jgi:hypothetical protein
MCRRVLWVGRMHPYVLVNRGGGRSPQSHWDPFKYTTLSLFKKSRKEMASLCKNGQEYKCPFLKSAREILQKASLKNTLSA